MSENNKLLEQIKQEAPGEIRIASAPVGESFALVEKDDIRAVLDYIKTARGLVFDMLVELFAVDYMGEEPRFEVVYILRSTRHNGRVILKTRVGEEEGLETVSDLWPAADFLEREVYDMFGVPFANHPDLRKIYTDDDLVGHPLRKDFPLEGKDFDKPFVVNLEKEKAIDG